MTHSKLALAVSFALGTLAHSAQAATYTVTTTAHGAAVAGSLSQAITNANNNAGEDTIVFDSAIAGQEVSGGNFSITESVIIDGQSNNITIVHNSESPLLTMNSSNDATLTLNNITLISKTGPANSFVLSNTTTNTHSMNLDSVTVRHDAAANASSHPAFQMTNADVDIKNSQFSAIDMNPAATTRQGAVLNVSTRRNNTINIDNSVFDVNTADGHGGALHIGTGAGSGITSTVNISNSSFSRNRGNWGGAMHLFSSNSDTLTANISNTTIAGNSCTNASCRGGAIYGATEGSTVDINLNNAIVADNSANAQANDIYTPSGTTVNTSYSLIEDNTGVANLTDNGNNILGQDPKLNAIAQNGSQIGFNYMPMNDSPVVNKGNPSATLPNNDLTGNSRVSGCTVDMGAIEVQLTGPTRNSAATTTYSITAADTELSFDLSSLFENNTALTYSVAFSGDANNSPDLRNLNATTGQLTTSISSSRITLLPMTGTVTATNSECASTSLNFTLTNGTTSTSGSSAISPWLSLLFSLPIISRLRRK